MFFFQLLNFFSYFIFNYIIIIIIILYLYYSSEIFLVGKQNFLELIKMSYTKIFIRDYRLSQG